MDVDKDNAKFAIHPMYPTRLLMIASADIPGTTESHGPIYNPYGGYYWCDDIHPLELLVQAIRRYNIDIHTSTEDTQGD
jgi:hypothetical protein